MAAADDPKAKPEDASAMLPPPPPEPPKEEPVATATAEVETDEEEPVFYPTDGPVTDSTITVAEGELAVEDAEFRFFTGTRQGTEAHEAAKQKLEEARANLRVARRARRY